MSELAAYGQPTMWTFRLPHDPDRLGSRVLSATGFGIVGPATAVCVAWGCDAFMQSGVAGAAMKEPVVWVEPRSRNPLMMRALPPSLGVEAVLDWSVPTNEIGQQQESGATGRRGHDACGTARETGRSTKPSFITLPDAELAVGFIHSPDALHLPGNRHFGGHTRHRVRLSRVRFNRSARSTPAHRRGGAMG